MAKGKDKRILDGQVKEIKESVVGQKELNQDFFKDVEKLEEDQIRKIHQKLKERGLIKKISMVRDD